MGVQQRCLCPDRGGIHGGVLTAPSLDRVPDEEDTTRGTVVVCGSDTLSGGIFE